MKTQTELLKELENHKDHSFCNRCLTLKVLLQQNKDFEELIENIKNPYPTDIFPKLTQLELDKVNALLEQVLKFPLDRLSAELMRRARNNFKEELKQKLKGGEK